MRQAEGPTVKKQGKEIQQQHGHLGLGDLRQYRVVGNEGQHLDRVVLDMHMQGLFLDCTERQKEIDCQVIPAKEQARMFRREKSLDLRLHQILFQRQ